MNVVAVIGRLTKDPEVRYTPDGTAIATMTVAIDRPPKKDGTKETDFPRITVFGKTAENCGKFLKKGLLVGANGRIQTGSYTNKNGDKVYTTDIVADRVHFLEWAEEKQEQPVQQYQYQPVQYPQQNYQPVQQNYQPNQYQNQQMPSGFEAIQDDNIPF